MPVYYVSGYYEGQIRGHAVFEVMAHDEEEAKRNYKQGHIVSDNIINDNRELEIEQVKLK